MKPGEAVRRKEDGTYTIVPEDSPVVDERSSEMTDQYVLNTRWLPIEIARAPN